MLLSRNSLPFWACFPTFPRNWGFGNNEKSLLLVPLGIGFSPCFNAVLAEGYGSGCSSWKQFRQFWFLDKWFRRFWFEVPVRFLRLLAEQLFRWFCMWSRRFFNIVAESFSFSLCGRKKKTNTPGKFPCKILQMLYNKISRNLLKIGWANLFRHQVAAN